MVDLQYSYLLISFLAGILTVLSPCVLPTLPIVLSASLRHKSFWRPLRIISSLAVSIVIFTLLLKVSTVLIGVPDYVWRYFSGGILLIFGLFLYFNAWWVKVSEKSKLKNLANNWLTKSLKRHNQWGDYLLGASLGPVFSSCSPTYALILSVSLPASWLVGLVYLLVFVSGLMCILILVAGFGQKVVSKLSALNKAGGWFQRLLAIIFIIVGLAIITGYDKQAEAYLVREGYYDWLINLEENLLD